MNRVKIMTSHERKKRYRKTETEIRKRIIAKILDSINF